MDRVEFHRSLRALGWSQRELGRKLGACEKRITGWANNRQPIPRDVADWLRGLVAAHAALPPPDTYQVKPVTRKAAA